MARHKERAPVGQRPPSHARRVNAWAELPKAQRVAKYETEDGRPVVVRGRERQVLAALALAPLIAASTVRLSHYVHQLREKGVDILCTIYENEEGTKVGVYTLLSVLRPARTEETA